MKRSVWLSRRCTATLTALLLVGSAIQARPIADFPTMEIRVGGELVGHATVVDTIDGRASLVEMVGPDGSTEHVALDPEQYESILWQEEYSTASGFVRGQMKFPTPTGSVTYQVSSGPTSEGRIETFIWNDDDPGEEIQVLTPEQSWRPSDGYATQNWGPLVVAVAYLCDKAQEKAQRNCYNAAWLLCGQGGTASVDATGICGQGACSIKCKPVGGEGEVDDDDDDDDDSED